MNQPVAILDTTLRDGGYLIDFSFTPQDTAIVAGVLDGAGIDFIEIGHGMGLGDAMQQPLPYPWEAYFTAVRRAVVSAKWGVFFIPGWAGMEHLDVLAENGGDFVRVGVNVDEMEKAIPYLERAKAVGLFTALNLMKTYTLTPEALGRQLGQLMPFTCDVVYIVDSSGGMLPEDVVAYAQSVEAATGKPFGFHAHNNLDMANANTFAAIKAGAAMVDASLMGMGRNAGNCVTESLVLALRKAGLSTKYDYDALMRFAEFFIKPLCHKLARDPVSYISGFSDFHSSFYDVVESYSKTYHVDVIDLIKCLTSISKTDVTESMIMQAIGRLGDCQPRNAACPRMNRIKRSTAELALDLSILAKKKGKLSFLNLVQADVDSYSNIINEFDEVAYANCKYATGDYPLEIMAAFQGAADFFYLSARSPQMLEYILRHSLGLPIITYDDDFLWVHAALDQIRLLTKKVIPKISVIGRHVVADKLRTLVAMHAALVLLETADKADAIVLFAKPAPDWRPPEGVLLLDGLVGLIDVSDPRFSQRDIYRLEMTPNVASQALLDYRKSRRFARSRKGCLVANGLIGREGDIVVDNVDNPAIVFGIADGKGYIKDFAMDDKFIHGFPAAHDL